MNFKPPPLLVLAMLVMAGAAQAQMATPAPSVPPAAQPLKPTARKVAPMAADGTNSAPKAPRFESNAGATSAASQEAYPGSAQVVVPLGGQNAQESARSKAGPGSAKTPCDPRAPRGERSACRKAALSKTPA